MTSILQHRPECVDAPFQVEMESTSDDTPSLKRKSISLNADGGGADAGMSRQEKREYRKRLKMDLQQVQGINQKLEALEHQVRSVEKAVEVVTSSFPPAPLDLGKISRGATTPPAFAPEGHHNNGKEKRTPKANQMYSNSEYISAKDKMPPPEKVRPKGILPGSSRKGMKQELDYKRQRVEATRVKRMADIMKMCNTVLKKLMTHKYAWVFNEPVDAVKLGLHDYHKVISHPMDLGTIKKNLESGGYSAAHEFAEHVRLTFRNAMQYNPAGHDVYVMANTLKLLFEERWRSIKEKLDEEQMKCRAEDEVLAEAQREVKHAAPPAGGAVEDQVSLSRKGGTPRGGGGGSKKAGKRTMTYEEKSEMGKNLEFVLEKYPGRTEEILQLIKRHNLNSQTDDTIEVDIDVMDNETLWELHKLVSQFMKIKPKKKGGLKQQEPVAEGAKATVAGSGEGGEEDVDVDVDDDDMPTANFPSVVIDKDTDAPNDGSKTSDSSSSSSGSSSSESDSGNSSDSDSDAEGPRNGQKPVTKDCVVTEPVTESPEQPDVVNQNGEPESQADKSASSVEKLQSERPVSPEKSLRAALLKGRFADTILKAREKNFPLKNDNNVDPEKLRKEREELERKQREDRARLQAEAKAAEVARKKAEAEAASEARKKREIEREAARRALQQMERTVDLDAHCEILKDFDLMRSSSMEQFQSSAGEVSPANSPEGGIAGGFGVVGSNGMGNPLEQLGLFMKLDEEEDEKQGDGEVAYVEGTDENGEVEEGEID